MNPLKKDHSNGLMATVRVFAFAVGAFLFFLVLILLLCAIAIINLTRFELSDQAANSSEMAPCQSTENRHACEIGDHGR